MLPTDYSPQKSKVSLSRLLATVGRPWLTLARDIRGMFSVLRLTLYYLIKGKIRWKETFRQAYNMGNRSLLFLGVILGFLGMISIFQAAFQAERITGDLHLLGAVFLKVLLREFGPTITALMLATRIGTGIAAEIGSMVVTEQVDALRMNGAQPVEYLIVPRFIAMVTMIFPLVIYASIISWVAGAFLAHNTYDVSYATYFSFAWVRYPDLIIMASKSIVYGITIPVVAGQAGLNAVGGSEGVGWATTAAVVNCSLAVVFLDLVVSGLAYLIFPIG